MAEMYWEYRPEWSSWWLMIPNDGLTAVKGYGPFLSGFEVEMAADVHGVPFHAPANALTNQHTQSVD